MEISDVLTALEELKIGIESVKSANENVAKAATAARMVCEAFGACSSRLEEFPATSLEPIRDKVAEIASASTEMVRCFGESVEGLRNETKNISDIFRSTVANACERIRGDINEFHREIMTFESTFARMANRVEEKVDGLVVAVKVVDETMHSEMESFASAQNKALEALGEKVEKAEALIENEIGSRSDGLATVIVQKVENTRVKVEDNRDAILRGIGSLKRIVIVTAIVASVAVVCTIAIVVKTYGVLVGN